MNQPKKFREVINTSYNFKGDSLLLGTAMVEDTTCIKSIYCQRSEKGIPTALVRTLLRAPYSRMDIINETEFQEILGQSSLKNRYNKEIDRESAYEKLTRKLEQVAKDQDITVEKKSKQKTSKTELTFFETLSKNTMIRQMGRTLMRELSRGILGVLGATTKRR
jgi:hypothetical protein